VVITHDLHVARAVADELVVLERGRLVEHGPVDDVLGGPTSAAGRALVDGARRYLDSSTR
jgi:ABC-type microcin C transport system duplicated ATPase subunit YejF